MDKPKSQDTVIDLKPPLGLAAHAFTIGAEEFVLLEFALPNPQAAFGLGAELSPSERAVLSLLLKGASNAAVALARGTSPRTVANQIAAIFRKLGVSSRRQLFALYGASEGAP